MHRRLTGCEDYVVVGNEVESESGSYLVGTNHFLGANVQAGSKDKRRSEFERNFPPSLYLNKEPPSLDRWPLYGP